MRVVVFVLCVSFHVVCVCVFMRCVCVVVCAVFVFMSCVRVCVSGQASSVEAADRRNRGHVVLNLLSNMAKIQRKHDRVVLDLLSNYKWVNVRGVVCSAKD